MKKKLDIKKGIVYILVLLGALLILVPFIWMISTSLKDTQEVFTFPPELFGERIVWENYTQISERFDYAKYFLNSVIVSLWVVPFQVLTSASAGYAFAKMNFKGRECRQN